MFMFSNRHDCHLKPDILEDFFYYFWRNILLMSHKYSLSLFSLNAVSNRIMKKSLEYADKEKNIFHTILAYT